MANEANGVAKSQQAITISYSISTPSNVSTSLDPKRNVQIPVGDLTSLSQALNEARNETNTTLTQWKDEIGELEKIKEARVVKEAEERRRLKKEAAAADDDEGDSEDEEENEE